MQPILEPFIEYLKGIELSPPQIPYLSNLTGTWITAAEATDYSYWAEHLRHTVRFADGLRKLLSEPDMALLEVGPGRTLSGLTADFSGETDERPVVASTRHPKSKESDVAFWLEAVGQLWLAGVDIAWKAFYADESRRRISLPTYPFERKRFWIEAQGTEKREGAQESEPLRAGPELSKEPAPLSPAASPTHAQARNGSAPRETEGIALEQVIARQSKMITEQIRLQSHILSKQLEVLKSRNKGA
jgi:acyl transferase domain-containing protein